MKYLIFLLLSVAVSSLNAQAIENNQIITNSVAIVDNMAERFVNWQEFKNDLNPEVDSATQVYKRRKNDGLIDYALATYDFVFVSDSKVKLDSLKKFLSTNYGYKIKNIEKEDEYWELTGDATEFPVDEENLKYWAVDLYNKGYEFDCKLNSYGSFDDATNQRFPDLSPTLYNHYFDLAMAAYDKRNFGAAIIYWSMAIKIEPADPNSWYSRATAKDDLHLWKAARQDYDKAIELAPDFTAALINRGANKDKAGEYDEAIKDYDKVIELDPKDAMAFFNRGNSKLNKKDKTGACEDWNRAKELGADYAQKRIDDNCKK